jgi:hypothetical protein
VVRIEPRAERRAQPARADEVLDRDRHAGQRSDRLAARDPGVDGPRRGAGTVGIERAERVQAAVERGDARERVVENRFGRSPGRSAPASAIGASSPGCGAAEGVIRIVHGAFRCVPTNLAIRLPV